MWSVLHTGKVLAVAAAKHVQATRQQNFLNRYTRSQDYYVFYSQTLKSCLRWCGSLRWDHCCTITNIVLSLSRLFPSAPDGGIYGIFLFFWSLPRAVFSCHTIHYHLRFLFILGVSLKEYVCVCNIIVYEIPTFLRYILKVSRMLPRISSNFFSSYWKVITFDLLHHLPN